MRKVTHITKDRINFEAAPPRKKLLPFLRFVVLPVTLIATLFLLIGVYSLSQASILMRHQPKPLEDFSVNILPQYSIAYFTSFDQITPLSGWFFSTKATPKSTVIMVHGYHQNRLQFDADTVEIYRFLLENGYNVLSFDLRHSGNSGGNLSAFGYSEWEDVLAAIAYARQITSTTDVILYGFDSGAAACLIAIHQLIEASSSLKGIPERFQTLGFDHTYIRSLILDSPPTSAEDTIRQICREDVCMGKAVGQYTIPYAVRLSAKTEKEYRLTSILGRIPSPVLILSEEYKDPFLRERSEWLIGERTRLFPNLTATWCAGFISDTSPFLSDQTGYLDAIEQFLSRFNPTR
jgi:uncharacterized protein